MRKIVISVVLFSLGFSPINTVLASPGSLDQYGGHNCKVECADWSLEQNEYHFHEIPTAYSFFSGYTVKASTDMVFYMPKTVKVSVITQPDSFLVDPLAENNALDASLCGNEKVFAPGRYDNFGNVRVKPVCETAESEIEDDGNLYKDVVQATGETIAKVYHIENHDDGMTVYTDAPTIEELKGSFIQGETDSAVYMVDIRTNALQRISTAEAYGMYGSDWESKILYFDDAIVYSYPMLR